MALDSQDVEAIRKLAEDEWTQAALARDWDKSLSLCSDDIVYMAPDQPVIRGHAELRKFLEQFPTISAFTQSVELVGGRALAVACFTGALTVEIGGKNVVNTVKGVGYFQKQATGGWLVTAVCFNWDNPMPSA